MNALTLISIAATALASSTLAQTTVCSAADFAKIPTWMAACDSITGGSAAKCANRACHNALHRLEEEDTKACWAAFGGDVSVFGKYAALDAFCHGEGPDPEVPVAVANRAMAAPASNSTTPVCAPEDGATIISWMLACDSVEGDLAAKCANRACHNALHRLEEEETHACWEFLGLGTEEDFHKYAEIDAFCHGEDHGSDHH